MTNLRNPPKYITKVVAIQPKYILQKEACKYCSMEGKLFRKAAHDYRLTVYGRGPKKIWYKVEELDKMMESFLIIDRKSATI